MALRWTGQAADHLASTGPPPRGGGNEAHDSEAIRGWLASTGPPPRGGGNLAGSSAPGEQALASTGPPPRGGGNSSGACGTSFPGGRFNGAAPARGRKFAPESGF